MDVREVMTPRVDVVALTIPVARRGRGPGGPGVRATAASRWSTTTSTTWSGVLFVNDLFRSAPGRPTAGRRGEPVRPPRMPGRPSTSRGGSRRPSPTSSPSPAGSSTPWPRCAASDAGFAVVVDEYGGVAGVLTVKDLLEPLVGDLHDEFDPADDEPTIVRVDGTRWLVDGRASVDDVRDRLGIELPDGEYVTLGGFLFDGFGHIPEEGEQLQVDGWELRVVGDGQAADRQGGGRPAPRTGRWADGASAPRDPRGVGRRSRTRRTARPGLSGPATGASPSSGRPPASRLGSSSAGPRFRRRAVAQFG